jgi:hypothetical protein
MRMTYKVADLAIANTFANFNPMPTGIFMISKNSDLWTVLRSRIIFMRLRLQLRLRVKILMRLRRLRHRPYCIARQIFKTN